MSEPVPKAKVNTVVDGFSLNIVKLRMSDAAAQGKFFLTDLKLLCWRGREKTLLY